MPQSLHTIAAASLRACYVEGKVVASPTHFSDFWARDTFWALPGMLAIGDYAQAKHCLEYFLSFQRADGKIPRKISRDINVLKYLFGRTIKRRNPRPTYHGLVKPFYAMDSELLFVSACAAYVQATGDHAFLCKHYAQIEKALLWHVERAKGGLLQEAFLGNWMDTVFKFGPVLYTNVLYVHALQAMEAMAEAVASLEEVHHNDPSIQQKSAAFFRDEATKAQQQVQNQFWKGQFFADESRLAHRSTFDLAGNVLAIHYDVATTSQKVQIVAHLKRLHARHGTFLPAVPTGQKWWKINPIVRLLGIADYHTTTSWLWIDAFVAAVFAANGEEALAQKIWDDITDAVVRDGEVGETYFQSGQPYKKRLWKSARPFAWSSGAILAEGSTQRERSNC